MTNELSTTLEALAHLLDVHRIGTVVARSRRTDDRGVTEFDFTTNLSLIHISEPTRPIG